MSVVVVNALEDGSSAGEMIGATLEGSTDEKMTGAAADDCTFRSNDDSPKSHAEDTLDATILHVVGRILRILRVEGDEEVNKFGLGAK